MPNYERDTKNRKQENLQCRHTPSRPPQIWTWLFVLEASRAICGGVMVEKNDLGIFASLTLNFDISIFKMLSGGRGAVEKR